MHWSAYEIFSVISGVLLIGAALFVGGRMNDRAWFLVGGVGLIAYGIWVAQQTTGTYYFPIWIFVVPVVVAVLIIAKAITRTRADGSAAENTESPRDDG